MADFQHHCQTCSRPATAHITYGLYDQFAKGRAHHELNVCGDHSREVWLRIKGAVAAQIMHYEIREPCA